MKSRLKLKPGQKGTKALTEKYGADLICIRYRYDETTRTRVKTVELIVERKQLPQVTSSEAPNDVLVPVQIGYGEKELRTLAKTLGGRWDPDVKLWYLQLSAIKGTELEKNVVLGSKAKSAERPKASNNR